MDINKIMRTTYNLSRLEESIKEFNKIDKKILTNDQIGKFLDDIILSEFNFNTSLSGNVFRVRKIENDIYHNSFDSIFVPPAELVKLGRCNFDNQPIFYGAFDVKTCVLETKLNIGDKFSLGVFNLKKSKTEDSSIVLGYKSVPKNKVLFCRYPKI